jgi:DnaJ-class molecular chaperone with C-terminal Zn finger domain
MADTKLYEVLGVSKSASDQEIKKVSWNQVGVHVELELIVALAWLRALVPCGVI